MGLSLEGGLTLGALVVMFVVLLKEALGPDITVFSTVTFLWVCGVIDGPEATRGFSSPQVLTVGLLFVVAAAMKDTGVMRALTRRLLTEGESVAVLLLKMLIPAAALSAVMNNTPIVAMLAPEIRDWAAKRELPPSRFLIPLSYAAILGGTCTLIGTSTNLLVSGLMESEGMAPLSMFELSAVGVPASVLGVGFLTLLGHRLLPDRQAPDESEEDHNREFSVRLQVEEDCPLVGQEVEKAGLRHLEGLFLVEIMRGEDVLAPARPTDRIEAGDVLVLVGVAATVVGLLSTTGLVPVSEEEHTISLDRGRRVHEVVIPERSQLVGQNLRDVQFRRRYDAAVIAIHRNGQRLLQKLGDVTLRAGDTLLLEASLGFRRTWGRSGDFVILGLPSEGSGRGTNVTALAILVLMLLAMGSEALSPLKASAVAVVLLVILRCVPLGRARSSIDLSVLILMASSFGLSAAVENSGLASFIAALVLGFSGDLGPWIGLAGVYLLCSVVTEALSNTAAAALTFPIAVAVASALDVDPRPFAVAVAMAASMSFVTPLGYQTNLLVYGPGGYRFGDFARVGVPMAVLCFLVSILLIPRVWGF